MALHKLKFVLDNIISVNIQVYENFGSFDCGYKLFMIDTKRDHDAAISYNHNRNGELWIRCADNDGINNNNDSIRPRVTRGEHRYGWSKYSYTKIDVYAEFLKLYPSFPMSKVHPVGYYDYKLLYGSFDYKFLLSYVILSREQKQSKHLLNMKECLDDYTRSY
jgi:hypothetical protein